MKKIYMIFILTIAGLINSYSQKDSLQTRKYILSINPVRVFFDEITVNFETRIDKPVIYGISLGYIHPQETLGEMFAYDEWLFFPNLSVKLRSSGLYTGLYIKFLDPKSIKSKNYYTLILNNRICYADHVGYAVNMSGAGSYDETFVSQTRNSTGVQFQYARRFDVKYITHEIYLGFGVKLDYTDTEFLYSIPAREENLGKLYEDGFRVGATFHMGYRFGIKL